MTKAISFVILYIHAAELSGRKHPRAHADIAAWPEVIKLEYSLRLKIKRNDWLIADKCPQAAIHCALF